jgi:hypothetical protein
MFATGSLGMLGGRAFSGRQPTIATPLVVMGSLDVKSAELHQVQAECLDFSQHTVKPGAIENHSEERFPALEPRHHRWKCSQRVGPAGLRVTHSQGRLRQTEGRTRRLIDRRLAIGYGFPGVSAFEAALGTLATAPRPGQHCSRFAANPGKPPVLSRHGRKRIPARR